MTSPSLVALTCSLRGRAFDLTPQAVLAKHPAFQAEKERLVLEWKGSVPWHLLFAAEDVANQI
jgi:hypothetical protein